MSTTTLAPNAADRVAEFPLITREALFGNPTKAGGQISRDGQWLGWMAPHDGVMNVWAAPTSDPGNGRLMTHSTDRPIPAYFFTPDCKGLLYVQDKAGDENFLVYHVDLASGAERCLTPFENTRARIQGISHKIKDKILVGLNNRDARHFDVHLLDLNTGELTMVMQNDEGYIGYLGDDDLQLRYAIKQNAEGGSDMFLIEDGKIAAEPAESTGLEDSLTTHVAGFTSDGQTLYWYDSRGRNTAALLAQDMATGEKRVIAEDAKADIGGTMRDPVTHEVQAYSVNYLKTEWVALDPSVASSLEESPTVSSRVGSSDAGIRFGTPVKPAAAAPPHAKTTTPVARTALPVTVFRNLDRSCFIRCSSSDMSGWSGTSSAGVTSSIGSLALQT